MSSNVLLLPSLWNRT